MGSVHAGRAGAGKEALQRGERPETGIPATWQSSGVSALLCGSQGAPPSTWPQIPFTPQDLPVRQEVPPSPSYRVRQSSLKSELTRGELRFESRHPPAEGICLSTMNKQG